MEDITKPSITRLARKAGIKSISEDCFETIRNLVDEKLKEVISVMLIVNAEHNTKTLMVPDVYESLRLLGYNMTESSDIGKSTYASKSSSKTIKIEPDAEVVE